MTWVCWAALLLACSARAEPTLPGHQASGLHLLAPGTAARATGISAREPAHQDADALRRGGTTCAVLAGVLGAPMALSVGLSFVGFASGLLRFLITMNSWALLGALQLAVLPFFWLGSPLVAALVVGMTAAAVVLSIVAFRDLDQAAKLRAAHRPEPARPWQPAPREAPFVDFP